MVTVEQVEIYDQNGKMLGVLDNADGIGYELKHNDLWTGSFALPTDDPKNAFCQGAQSRPTAGWQPRLGRLPHHWHSQRGNDRASRHYHLQRGACDGDAAG